MMNLISILDDETQFLLGQLGWVSGLEWERHNALLRP